MPSSDRAVPKTRERVWVSKMDHTTDPPTPAGEVFIENGVVKDPPPEPASAPPPEPVVETPAPDAPVAPAPAEAPAPETRQRPDADRRRWE